MKETTPKVSVIFPIYNNERYLKRCIQSVLEQTLQDIEIILIDDGSTDSAPAIVDEFAEMDERVRVVHKQNEGSAAGRNQGINMARGEYVAFVESDDYVAVNMYEKLYERAKATDADIVKCGFYKCTETFEKEFDKFYGLADEFEVFEAKEHSAIFRHHASIWASLYRRSFLNDCSLRFLVTPKATYSDFSWMAMTYAYAKRITILHMPLYYYTFDNPDSSHFMSGERYQYKLYHAKESNRILRETGIFDEVKEDIAVQEFGNCRDAARRVLPEQREDCFNGLNELCKDLVKGGFEYKHFNARQRNLFEFALKGEMKKFYELLFLEFIMYDPAEFSGKKVVIWGAGRCGQSYVVQLKKHNVMVVKIVDSKSDAMWGIEPPDVLNSTDFDLVLIAVVKEEIAKEIKEQLLAMEVPEKKIVWKAPMKIG